MLRTPLLGLTTRHDVLETQAAPGQARELSVGIVEVVGFGRGVGVAGAGLVFLVAGGGGLAFFGFFAWK